MEISNNIINQVTDKKNKPVLTKQVAQVPFCGVNSTNLPSSHTVGQSQINANIPVSYTKIAEIPIPNLENKASVFKLANGQKVVILPKKGPTYIKTTYNVGSMNETDDIRGISHFIEHNLFNGSKDLPPREYDKKVSDLGGGTNASTSYNYTDYYLRLQLHDEKSLEEAIKLNAMQTQYPTFPVEQVEKEKGPVKSEINLYLDMPYDVSSSTAINNLFGIQTAATNAIIGTEDNINSMTQEKLFDYFNTWYTPDNAVTVITGDVDVNETIALVSKYYNKQNDYSHINKRHYEKLVPIDKPIRRDVVMPNSSSADVSMAFAIPEGTTQSDRVKIDTLFSLLEASNSKLVQALDKYGVAVTFHTEKMQNKPDGAEAIICNVELNEEDVEEVIKILYEEITNIANNPPSQEELDAIKNRRLYAINNVAERSSDINAILTNMMLENDMNYLYNTSNIIQSLTPQDIADTARKFLDLNKVSMCVAHSKDSTSSSINTNYHDVNSVQKTVSFGSSKVNDTFNDYTSDVQHYRLQNNIETRIFPSSPTLKSSMVMTFSTDELNGFSAPAFNVLNTLINRGNIFRTNEEVAQLKDSKDFELSYTADEDGISIVSEFYTQDMREVLGLFKETMMNPNFTQAEFDRAKEIIKANIMSESPSAYDNVANELFGDKVATFKSKQERLAEIDALTLADVQYLYSVIMGTAQVSSTINAPIGQYPYLVDEINNQLAIGLPVFQPVTKSKSQSYNIYEPNTQGKIITEANESKQAQIIQAYTYKRTENIDDIAKIFLMDSILGGGMSSRLFKDLREDKKLAYSVYSDIFNKKDTSVLMLAIGTPTDTENPNEGSPENVKIALDGFNRHVNDLKTKNVSQEELDKVKLQLKTELLNSIESTSDKLVVIHSDSLSKYDINYSKALMDAIDKITVDDIRAAANYVFANPPITSIVASQKTLDALNLSK